MIPVSVFYDRKKTTIEEKIEEIRKKVLVEKYERERIKFRGICDVTTNSDPFRELPTEVRPWIESHKYVLNITVFLQHLKTIGDPLPTEKEELAMVGLVPFVFGEKEDSVIHFKLNDSEEPVMMADENEEEEEIGEEDLGGFISDRLLVDVNVNEKHQIVSYKYYLL